MDAQTDQTIATDGAPEAGVVASSVYSGGRRIKDIAIEEAGEWSKRPGHVVWIGLFEPSTELLQRVQAQLGLHDLAIEDAGKAHQHPKIEQYGEALFIVARTAQMIDGRIAFGETHLFVGPRLRGLGSPRRFDLLRRRARALRVLPDRPVPRRRLHPLRHPRFHRRQLHAGAGNAPRAKWRRSRTACSPSRPSRSTCSGSTCCAATCCAFATPWCRWSRSAAGSSMPR